MHDIVFFYPEGHEAHYERGHPERPARVEAIRDKLTEAGLWDAHPHLDPLPIPDELLQSVHDPAHLARLQTACESGQRLDSDTYITQASWQLALNAAGGAISVAQAVWNGEAKRGFALTRPPGHHATRRQSMGFCLLNNEAIAAEFLLQKGAKKLAIVDIDLHHGNGTQDIFYDRGEVLFLSTHQMPLYPGTGYANETGTGAGAGTTVNIPLPPYSGDRAFQTAHETIILPLLARFQPEMLLVTLGFDAHWRDPLGHLLVSANGYGETIARLATWAGEHCHGRIALFLAGGYDVEAGAVSALAATNALLGQPWDDPIGPSPVPEGNAWEGNLQKVREIWEL